MPVAGVWSRPETCRIHSTPAQQHLAAYRRPSIPPRQPPVPPQHPSTRSHAPPPSVCICIARTITTAVDTSKSRTGALASASSPDAQAKKHRAQASEPRAQAQKPCAQSAASRCARLFALRAMCGNSVRKAFSSASKVRRLARKAQKAVRKPMGFAREVAELGVPSKKPCAPSKSLCESPPLPRPPHSACGCSAAEARASAAWCRAPLGGIHAPLSLSGLSATTLGVSPAASRASAVVGGAPLSKARAFRAKGAVRVALGAACRARRGIGRSNGVAREFAELGTPL